MTPAEQKQAEANGAGLREIKSEVASNSSSEELPPFQKRSRRKECIYITIAVILGAGLIAVLVYFSVTNALKENEPEERKNTGAEYSTTESTTSFDYSFDYQSGSDYDSGNDQAGSGMTRDASAPNRMTRNMDPGSLARGLPVGPDDVQADTQVSEGTGQNLLAGGMQDSPNDEQADTKDAEGAGQLMTKTARTLPGRPEQGDGIEADESENMDQNSQPADNVDGSDAGFVKQARTLKRGGETEGDEGENMDQNSQPADNVDGSDAGFVKQARTLKRGGETEGDEGENMDQNSQPADNVDGSDAGFVKQARTLKRGGETEGDEGDFNPDADTSTGNTEQGEQVEDTVKENPEQNFHLADNRDADTVQEEANQEQPSGIPQKMARGVLRPPTQEPTE